MNRTESIRESSDRGWDQYDQHCKSPEPSCRVGQHACLGALPIANLDELRHDGMHTIVPR